MRLQNLIKIADSLDSAEESFNKFIPTTTGIYKDLRSQLGKFFMDLVAELDNKSMKWIQDIAKLQEKVKK